MPEAFICDYARTPIGRFGGALAGVRPDDLLAFAIRPLIRRNEGVDWARVDDVVVGCANQAGEDNRNVGRMAALLSGLPVGVPGSTVNRLCGSGLDAVVSASRAIKTGEATLIIAGGTESASRAPFVLPRPDKPHPRNAEIFDTVIGWRLVNPIMKRQYGIDSMPETAENVAAEYAVSREDQDRYALRSQQRAAHARANGRLDQEIIPVEIPRGRGEQVVTVTTDESPRDTSLEQLAALQTPFRDGGSVTAGNMSSLNDGAAAVLIASEQAVTQYNLSPIARILGGSVVGVPPRLMGIGPEPATRRLCNMLGLDVNDFDVIELNEAFASQCLAVLRGLGIKDDAEHVNPNGGAIALGHPFGMSGARLAGTVSLELRERELRRGLATMCIGVGQGIAVAFERA